MGNLTFKLHDVDVLFKYEVYFKCLHLHVSLTNVCFKKELMFF